MRLARVLVLSLVTFIALLQTPAVAGGWWSTIDLDGAYLGIGEKVKVRSEVLFKTVEDARRAQNVEYRAYLLRGLDPRWPDRLMSQAHFRRWWQPPGAMINVGSVEVSSLDSNLVTTTARLAIPDVAPGSYDLMFCTVGCRKPLADIVPLAVDVTADAVAARTARDLQRTNERLAVARARLRFDLRRLERRARETRETLAESTGRIIALEAQLARAESDRPSPSPLVYVGWFIAGSTVALIGLRRRRRTNDWEPMVPMVDVPDDARELVDAR